MTMWRHVSDATIVDVVEGSADGRILSHVAGCERCRLRVDEAREAWGWAERAAAPEPVPAYWDVFRRRVSVALAEPPTARSRRPWWTAAAVAGAAMIALLAVVPGGVPVAIGPVASPPVRALPAWSALPPADEDPGLPFLEQVAPAAAAAAPLLECSELAECVATLSDDESRALVDVLRHELGPELRPGTTL